MVKGTIQCLDGQYYVVDPKRKLYCLTKDGDFRFWPEKGVLYWDTKEEAIEYVKSRTK